MVKISEYALCKFLEHNGRTTAAELARLTNVTETAIRKKMRKLEQKKVILGYKTIIDWKALERKI